MKKTLTRILSLTMILVALFSFASSALAASKTSKGTDTQRYTITTGSSDCELRLEPQKGEYAQKWVDKKKSSKTTVKTHSIYASYTVSINGKDYTVKTSTVKVKLKAKTSYSIQIKYNGVGQIYAEKFPIGLNWVRSGSHYWKSNPGVKLNTGLFGAKIY